MAKKKTLKNKASGNKSSGNAKGKPSGLAESLVGSANEIWLAGLGAFAKAQTEGKKIYDKLIDEGKDFEKLFKSVPNKTVKSVKTTVDTAKKRASESWDKLEDVFEKRVEKSLKSLGVPSNKELNKLTSRIESLTEEVNKLAKAKKGSSKKATAKKTTAKKTTAKKATAKKTTAKKTTAKKATAKKTTAKKATAKKTTAKKSMAKKTTAKKATAKKATAKKATAKKSRAKKTTAKKTTADKTTAKYAPSGTKAKEKARHNTGRD